MQSCIAIADLVAFVEYDVQVTLRVWRQAADAHRSFDSLVFPCCLGEYSDCSDYRNISNAVDNRSLKGI